MGAPRRLHIFYFDRERNAHFLPPKVNLSCVVRDRIEAIFEPFLTITHRLRFGLNAERVLSIVILETAPLSGIVVEDDGPLRFAWYCMHAVRAGFQWLSVDQDIVGHLKHCRFIRASAPDMIVGNDGLTWLAFILIVQSSFTFGARGHRRRRIRKNRSALYGRTTVSDRNISHANCLHDTGLLARSYRFYCQRRLLRNCETRHTNRHGQNCKTEQRKSFYGNHGSTPCC